MGFLLFGTCLGHLSYMANLVDFRPAMLWFFLCVELSDIFAYLVGSISARQALVVDPAWNVEGLLAAARAQQNPVACLE